MRGYSRRATSTLMDPTQRSANTAIEYCTPMVILLASSLCGDMLVSGYGRASGLIGVEYPSVKNRGLQLVVSRQNIHVQAVVVSV